MRYLKAIVVAIALLAPFAASSAEDGKLFWPIPWEKAPVLKYEVIDDAVKESAEQKTTSKASRTTTITTNKQADGSFLQEWADSDMKIGQEGRAFDEVVGDEAALKSLVNLKISIALDKDGNYQRIDNIDAISVVFREALEKVFLQNMTKLKELSPEKAEKAKAIQANMINMLSQKEVLEAVYSKMPFSYHYYVGGGLDPTMSYESEQEGENPFGGKPFPMKNYMEFSLDEEDPGFATAIWQETIDSEKAAETVLELVEKMLNRKIKNADREKMSKQIELTIRVDYRVELATGIIHEIKRVETKKVMQDKEVQTTTMVLMR